MPSTLLLIGDPVGVVNKKGNERQPLGQLALFPTEGVRVPVTRGLKNPLWFGVSDRLKRLREEAGLPALTLGNLAGVAHSTPHRLEQGTSVPTISVIERLAMALGVEPCWLAFGSDGEEPFRLKIPRLITPQGRPTPLPAEGTAADAHKGCGERLEAARQVRGLSMRQLARAAQLSPQTVSAVESGRVGLRLDNCEALAVALDVAPCWLAYGVGRGPVVN